MTPRRISSCAQVEVVDGARAVGDPGRVERERAPDLRGAAPLAGVEGDLEAARRRGLEGGGVDERIREGRLRSGEIEAGQALVAELGRGEREADVVGTARASGAPWR